MPPKTRGGKNTKASKENITANTKSKIKVNGKVTKPPRKVLADKTNSASDDNASVVTLKRTVVSKPKVQINLLCTERPRRERRIPTRFKENNVLQNLSNSQNVSTDNYQSGKHTPIKKVLAVVLSPLKLSERLLDSSLIARRPKRICRLPSKFDDHSISPSKFIPVQPVHASTPKLSSTSKANGKDIKKLSSPKKAPVSEKVISSKINKKKTIEKKTNNTSKNNSADTNNNAKQGPPQSTNKKTQSTTSKKSPDPKSMCNKKIVQKNSSFRVLEDKKSLKRDASKIDVYEFTFDPNDEPPPQKKKRKRPAKKKEPKPKIVTFKNNYDKNVAKALAALKNTVSSKSSKQPPNISSDNLTMAVNKVKNTETGQNSNVVVPVPTASNQVNVVTSKNTQQASTVVVQNNPSITNVKELSLKNGDKSSVSQKNYNSVRVEDIALDFEDNTDGDINYSPVNSPCRPITPPEKGEDEYVNRSVHNNDPLNLRDDLSFFDDQPVASSSMMSVKHPTASPWRAEFEKLPIKWQANTYVKPNMTPALESSFINSSENKKKHVYTNMVADTDNANLPHIFDDNNVTQLKQTSIMSFIKEVAERNAKKRKEKLTPIKANSVFETNDTSVCMELEYEPAGEKNPVTPAKSASADKSITPGNQSASNISSEKESSSDNSKETSKDSTGSSKKSTKKKKDKDITYFGFDDENQDQENVSPTKKIDKRKLRALRPRSRAVLQEINAQKGPMRAIIPVTVKSKPIHSDTVNKLFDEAKSATEPPVFADKEAVETEIETANVTEVQPIDEENNDDFQSLHLFEDLEVVHHVKPHRKSYGKSKKVTFRQNSISDSDIPTTDVAEQSDLSDEDDLHDLTFKIPAMETKKITRKKKTKKQKLSKKEEKEVEAWAAGFNSMCEDIDEFDLVVE